MAEFQEVMTQFHRMCKFYQSKRLCPMECPMNGLNISQCRKQITEAYVDVERIVMAWAVEHPEPAYPTWSELLTDVGLLINKNGYYAFNFAKAFDTIPADIAQKLGIEPKERDTDGNE